MEDPYGFIIPDCIYTSSQEDFFNDSLPFRKDISPGLYPPPPPTAAAPALDGNVICSDLVSVDNDVNAIIICSAPDSQVSDSGKEFKTPPEESRHSSSEEAPPHKLSSLHDIGGNGTSTSEADCGVLEGDTPDLGLSHGPKMVEVLPGGENQVMEASVVDRESIRAGAKQIALKEPPEESRHSSSEKAPPPKLSSLHGTGGNGTATAEADCGVLEGETLDLGFSQGPKMVEMLPNGENQVKEASAVDRESFRAGEKKIALKEPPPSEIVRISVDSLVLVKTLNGETQVKDVSDVAHDSFRASVDSTVIVKTDSLVEIEVEVGMNGENQVKEVSDVDHESFGAGQKRSAVEEPLRPSKRVRISVDSTDSPFEIEGKVEKSVETEAYFVDSGDTVVLDEDYNYGEEEIKETGVDNAKDLSRQERRELPYWARQNGDNRKKSEEAVDGPVGLLLEILALLAEEEHRSHGDNDDGTVDILETAKRRGMKFPEPKWWRELRDDLT